MKFQIILPKSVQKELDRLPDELAGRILTRLAGLETNPRPADVKKLKGRAACRTTASGEVERTDDGARRSAAETEAEAF